VNSSNLRSRRLEEGQLALGVDLVPLKYWRNCFGELWTSTVVAVASQSIAGPLCYKTRRLGAAELVEIDEVLGRLRTVASPSICRVEKYAIRDHWLHLLLDNVSGQSLDHMHDEAWRNENWFAQWTARHTPAEWGRLLTQVLSMLRSLHQHGLLFPDLKVEQLIDTKTRGLVAIDVDGLVLGDGLCARQGRWQSAGLQVERPCSVAGDLRRFLGLAYEVYLGRHVSDAGWVTRTYQALEAVPDALEGWPEVVDPAGLVQWLLGCLAEE
jgi:hypothetical protein